MKHFHIVTSNMVSVTGGSEVLWALTAKELLRRGYRVSLSLPDIPESRTAHEDIRKLGATIHYYYTQWDTLWLKVKGRVFGPRLKFASLRQERPDLVIISQGHFRDGIGWAEECIRIGVSFVTIAQAVRLGGWPTDGEAERVLRVWERARRNYFVSHGNLRDAETFLGATISAAEVIHNPPAMENREVLPWPSDRDVYRLASVGRICPTDKGQDLLFEALAQDKWRERPIEVNIFGQGDYIRIFRRLRDSMGLERLVSLRGHAPDILDVWRRHHGLVLPSRSEGFPLALIEAMWCGRFAVVSPVADNRLVIEHGINGSVMKSNSAEALDEALECAWQHRADWEQWGRKAHGRIADYAPRRPELDFVERILKAADDLAIASTAPRPCLSGSESRIRKIG